MNCNCKLLQKLINHEELRLNFEHLFVYKRTYNNDNNVLTKEEIKNFSITSHDIEGETYNFSRIEYGNENIINDGLYTIRGKPEIELIAEYLMYILSDINWLVAFDIASFAAEKWQRDIYFNCSYFENMVKSECLKSHVNSNQQEKNKT